MQAPAAAVQNEENTDESTALQEDILESFADVPVGEPASEESQTATTEASVPSADTAAESETADAAPDAEAAGLNALPEAVTYYPPTMEYNGVSYILIESEEELRKIGSGEKVSGTVFLRHHNADEDYAIVTDIALTEAWTPLDFCGTMIGAEVTEKTGVLGEKEYSLQERQRTLFNVNVTPDETSVNGVGFFGALYSKGTADHLTENGSTGGGIIEAILSGLSGVVSGLLGTVTGLLHDVAGLLVGWDHVTALGFEPVTAKNLVLDGVTLPDSVATEVPVGAFAGQISGNVTVKNCEVRDVSSISGQQWVGGFAGKTIGATSYLLNDTLRGLSDTLGGPAKTVDGLLNVLLPTEDLVGKLVEKLGVDNLVPVRYDLVKLTGCKVSFAGTGGTVKAAANYAGGFAGRLQGTQLTDCSVKMVQEVTGAANVGGFAGRINNAPIVGLLQGLGVNLVDFPAGCVVTDCTVSSSGLRITSTQTTAEGKTNLAYASGFAGAVMASTITVSGESAQCGVTGLSSVTATGDYVGGFAGYAGIGDLAEALNLLDSALNLQLKDDGSIELGSAVTVLLDKVLGVDLDAGVLSLIGIKASQMAGCSAEGDYTVSGGQRVGGFVGYLQGGRIVEQVVEQQYSRTQLTDKDGNPVYVAVDDIVDSGFETGGELISGVYGRRVNGTIVLEDVHGQSWTPSILTDITGKTVYQVYDSVYLDADGAPAHTASFRNQDWSALLKDDGKIVSNRHDLPDSGYNAVVPVYQQVTNSRGQMRFTYHSADGAQIVYRDNGDPEKFYDETGQPVSIVNADGLASDTLQAAVEDQLTDSGTTAAKYLTKINGLRKVSGSDYVGGVVGQATLASAADLVSSLTVAQYERFELNNVQLTGIADGYTVTATGKQAGGAMGGDIVNVNISNLKAVSAVCYAGGFGGEIIPGTVAGQDGNGLALLGLVTVSNLLTVIDAVHTFVNTSSVSGIPDGFTVSAQNSAKNSAAAGFVAWSINSKYTDCTVSHLLRAEGDSYAGGFCAVADTGSIAGVMENTFGGLDVKQLLSVNQLLSLLECFPNRFTDCLVNVRSSHPAYTVRAAGHTDSDTPGERKNAQNRDAANGTPPAAAQAAFWAAAPPCRSKTAPTKIFRLWMPPLTPAASAVV